MASKYPVRYWRIVIGLCGFLTFLGSVPRLSYAAQPVPDWTTWQCKQPIVSFDTIETRECHPPREVHNGCIILKLRGAKIPFLIGWGRNDQATRPEANEYAALYKNGRWIVGARGTGFTAEDRKASILFQIFLAPDFSIREKIEIRLPEIRPTGGPLLRRFRENPRVFWS